MSVLAEAFHAFGDGGRADGIIGCVIHHLLAQGIAHGEQLEDMARETLLFADCFEPEDESISLVEACGFEAEVQQPLRGFHLFTGNSERWRELPGHLQLGTGSQVDTSLKGPGENLASLKPFGRRSARFSPGPFLRLPK